MGGYPDLHNHLLAVTRGDATYCHHIRFSPDQRAFVHALYEFFTADAGIRYFSSHPSRVVYVMLLAVSGGLITLAFSRLSPASQRRLKLFALGGFGTILLAGLGFFAYLLWVLFDGSIGWAAASFVGGAWTAGLVWTEFRKLCRETRESRQPEH